LKTGHRRRQNLGAQTWLNLKKSAPPPGKKKKDRFARKKKLWAAPGGQSNRHGPERRKKRRWLRLQKNLIASEYRGNGPIG